MTYTRIAVNKTETEYVHIVQRGAQMVGSELSRTSGKDSRPFVFFRRQFFSRALLSERVEQAIVW